MDPATVAPPDEQEFRGVLVLLLALLLVAGALPFFAAAFVYRFFHSLRIVALLAAGLAALAVPALLFLRGPRPPAAAPAAAPAPYRAVSLGVLAAGLVALAVIGLGYGAGAAPVLLAVVALALPSVIVLIAVGAAGPAGPGGRPAAAAHYAACGAAMVLALLATALTSQTLDLGRLALAQANTLWYVVAHPGAAAAFLLASLAAVDHGTRDAVLGAPSALRSAAEPALLLVLGALFAAAFLAGDAAPARFGLAGFAVKTVAAATLIELGARVVRRRAWGGPGLAWLAAGLAWLDLVVTLAVLARSGA